MLSIVWTNKNDFLGNADGSNDNNFDVAFDRGTNTSNRTAAINVVQAAIDDWNRVITDFHYANGTNEFDVTFTMGSTGRTDNGLSALTNQSKDLNGNALLDSSGKPVTTAVGKPQSAAISITWDSVADSGTVIDGWYLDPSPNDLSDFKALGTDTTPVVGKFLNRTDAYFGLVPGGTHAELFGLDFFSTVEHELGHALGLSDFPQMSSSTVAHDNGITDVQNGSGTYWRVDTANVHSLWTSSNGGVDIGNPEHYAEAGATYTVPGGLTYYGANALMNSRDNFHGRKIIDDIAAQTLADVYGYTITLPSTFGTFYDTLDDDGTLRINTTNLDSSNSNEFLDLSVANGVLKVGLSLGSPVLGIDPGVIRSQFDLSKVKKIDVDLGTGHNTIFMHSISDSIPINLHENNPAATIDDLSLFGLDGLSDSFTIDLNSIKGHGIDIEAYNKIGELDLFTELGGADIYVPDGSKVSSLHILGGNGGESLRLQSLSANLPTDIDAGTGTNTIFLIGDGTFGGGPIRSRVTVFGDSGNDTLNVGFGNVDGIIPNGVDADVIFYGNGGNDTISFLDSANDAATKWFLGSESKVFRGTDKLREFDFDSVENVSVYTGPGGTDGNTIYATNGIHYNLSVNGGSGTDTVNLTDFTNRYSDGGFGFVTYDTHFDLGGGLNFLNINQTDGFETTYSLYPTQLIYSNTLAISDAVVNFTDISGGITVNAGDDSNLAFIYGVPSTFDGYQHTFYLNGGDDQFFVYPHDDAGNFSVNGSIGLSGGSGTDSVTFDDTLSDQGLDYTFDNPFGFQTTDVIFGNGGVGVGSDVEGLGMEGSSGDDGYEFSSYLSATTALTIHAGDGNDFIDITPQSMVVSENMSASVPFSFDGGSGINSFNLYNSLSGGRWFYTLFGNQINTTLVGSPVAYSLTMGVANFANVSVFGGYDAEAFFAEDVPSGQTVVFNGGAGYDAFYIADDSGDPKVIAGHIVIDGGADGGELHVYDAGNAVGSIVHVEDGADGTIGSMPGDTLFGPGGTLQFRNLSDNGSTPGVSLVLGKGADTIYARPLTGATLSIDAGNPTTSPGDQLNLILTQALNAVVHDTGGGTGNVTSSNRKPVQWVGVETLNSAATEPTGFLVTNTSDSGSGSLRQAILDANAAPNVGGPDVIRFAIPGAGTHSIRPHSALPGIVDPVVIDGMSQPGYAGTPVIELDGHLANGGNGLFITSGGTTVRGLAINRFVSGANGEIWIQGPGGNVIQGNYLGTNLAGNAVYPVASQASYGVIIFGSDANVIGTNGDGTADASEGNVISGHNTAGILLESGQPGEAPDNNVIAGNRIGTSADGNTALANARMGVFFIAGGTGNRVGTNSDGVSDVAERNVISGNTEAGISLDGNGNVIAGNYIGTNAAGNASVPNGYGVFTRSASNSRIGGTAPGAGNLIAFNLHDGVVIDSLGTGNSILGNSIYANGQLGINLNVAGQLASGVSPNDAGDVDTGPNNLQNFPQITTAFSSNTQTTVGGTLQSTPSTTFRVEFFSSPVADPSGFGEGEFYLGSTTVTTDSSGTASIATVLSTLAAVGQAISATATDPSGNTSEFSASVQVVDSSSLTNVAVLQNPVTSKTFLVSSPVGSAIAASVATTSTVAPPAGVSFPLGFLTFQITNLLPGAAADVTISGLDVSSITDYYKYGATPAVGTQHWYDFLFGHQTDFDSASGTGMEIVGGNLVLHLVDGGRGDDDVTANGVISDIGGPVTVNVASITSTHTVIASDHASGATYGQNVHFTVTVSPTTGSNTPSGFVQFQVDGQNFGAPRQLAGGTASIDAPALSAVDHAITALYDTDSPSYTNSNDDLMQHIARALLTVTAQDKSKVYGAALPALTAGIAGFVNSETSAVLTTLPTLSTTATSASPIGQYAIMASGGAAANYSFKYVDGKLAVTAAPLSIKADDKTKPSGAANPPLTFTATGLVNGDTPASLTKQPILSTTATTNSSPGTYAITASGAAIPNYAISYAAGTLKVTPNQSPIAGNDSDAVTKNTAVSINVLSNDNDPDGAIDVKTVAIVAKPQHGTVSVDSKTGLVTYMPAKNYTGHDSFTYKVKDSSGVYSNVATVSLTITAPNSPPVAYDDAVTTLKNSPITIAVLANDKDSDGLVDPKTVVIVAAAQHGTTGINPTTGAVTYTPAANFTGTETFTYKVKDNQGAYSNVATVCVTVVPPNIAPQANDDSATVKKNKSVAINVLANDRDSDGSINKTTLLIVAQPRHGTLKIDSKTGIVTYTPAKNYTGSDSFTYQVKDNLGALSNVAAVNLTVSS